MKLRYSANIMAFEDSMKKVSAITWSRNGKKLAVGAADRVHLFLVSPSISLIKMGRRKTNSQQSLPTKDRNHILFEDWSSRPMLNLRRLLLHKAITSFSSIKLENSGEKRKPSAINSQSQPQ